MRRLTLEVADLHMADGWVNVRKRKTPRGVRKVPISLRPQIGRRLQSLRDRGLYLEHGSFLPTRHLKPWTQQQAAALNGA